LESFCSDYNTADYWFAELPKLPYRDDSFDLVLSSHLLFVYDDRLDEAFHEASIIEMLRVSKEVRIFPLVDYKNSRMNEKENLSPLVYKIATKFGGEIVKIDFEFQSGAGYMLRIKR
jgi:ubiquinone/menaquinone biosynthesis C-methylase UbiE